MNPRRREKSVLRKKTSGGNLVRCLCGRIAPALSLFKPEAEKSLISLAAVDDLASRFLASNTATGSRFAAVVSTPCAFVLSEQGKVRYASRSTALREANAWISPRVEIPNSSLSARVRGGVTCEEPEEVDADIWFSDWERGGVLLEEARHLARWDQTLTLLWFEDEEVPPPKLREYEEPEEPLLEELDGYKPPRTALVLLKSCKTETPQV
jgi:hypothetical protein